MIWDIARVTLPGFAFGAVIMAMANRKAEPATARSRWLKAGMFFVIVHVVLGAAAAGRTWVSGLLLLVLAAGAWELAGAWRRIAPPRPAGIWPAFVAIAALVLWNGWHLPPETFAFLFIVTATNDGFSQVVGQWLGRRPLAPRLSPAKTVGGLVGGMVAAVTMAVLVRGLVPATLVTALVLGLCTAGAGLAGDLLASWVKRRALLKDYSAALPGQGGFLDRFDSLLGAVALVGSVLAAGG